MDPKSEVPIKRWELNAIMIEMIVLSGVTTGLAVGFLGRLSTFAQIPREALFGVGFVLLVVVQIPGLSVLARARGQGPMWSRSSVAWCVVGVFVYVVVARLLR